jgi:hypothetical protein
MSLQTIKVPYQIGRICYVTNSSLGINATVECPNVKKAFRFLVKRKRFNVGDWVEFRGFARVNKINKTTEEKIKYYHDPNDGSKRDEWIFIEMENVSDVNLVAPPEVLRDLKDSMDHIRRHIDSWTANSSSEDINETLNILSKTFNSLHKYLGLQRSTAVENENIKVTVIDITI